MKNSKFSGGTVSEIVMFSTFRFPLWSHFQEDYVTLEGKVW